MLSYIYIYKYNIYIYYIDIIYIYIYLYSQDFPMTFPPPMCQCPPTGLGDGHIAILLSGGFHEGPQAPSHQEVAQVVRLDPGPTFTKPNKQMVDHLKISSYLQ